MGLELGSEEVDIFGKIGFPETGRRTVQQDTPTSPAGEIEKSLPLGLDVQLIEIGEDEQDVIPGEVLFGQGLDGMSIGDIDGLRAQGLAQDAETGRGVMIEEILAAEEENLDPTRWFLSAFFPVGAGNEPLEEHSGAK